MRFQCNAIRTEQSRNCFYSSAPASHIHPRGAPPLPISATQCHFKAALCFISTPDTKPYILVKNSWKSDQNLKKKVIIF